MNMSVEWNGPYYFPKPIKFEAGPEVSYYTYATKEEAKLASAIADLETTKQALSKPFGVSWYPSVIREEDVGPISPWTKEEWTVAIANDVPVAKFVKSQEAEKEVTT